MARRSRSKPKAPWIFAAILLLAAVFAGATIFFSDEAKPFRTTPDLDIPAYLENSNSLRGNSYRLEAEVLDSLAWSPSAGRLISVDTGEDVLPILVTSEFNNINIQKGQGFVFFLEVDDRGVLRTKDLTKS